MIVKKILITGAKGEVGQVLTKKLKPDFEIVEMDLPEGDLRDYELLKEKTSDVDVIIHLAMDPEVGFMNELMNPDDFLIAFNIYKVAKKSKVPRVIMFSSIHADDYAGWKPGDEPKTVDTVPSPDSPYGAYKVYMETLGRYYSKQGLEVLCIRLGGVNVSDDPNLDEENYQSVYLSHGDLVGLMKKAVEIEKIPNNYELMYAVSDNEPLIHNFSNSIGWIPKEGTKKQEK